MSKTNPSWPNAEIKYFKPTQSNSTKLKDMMTHDLDQGNSNILGLGTPNKGKKKPS